jgi:hypothetical protein
MVETSLSLRIKLEKENSSPISSAVTCTPLSAEGSQAPAELLPHQGVGEPVREKHYNNDHVLLRRARTAPGQLRSRVTRASLTRFV